LYANTSTILPNKEANMVSIQEDACLAFVVKKGPKVHPTDHMPAPLKLLFKAFLYVLSSILQIRNLTADHLHVNVFGD